MPKSYFAVVALATVISAGCADQRTRESTTQNATPAPYSASLQTGRYAFYIDPASPQRLLSGGFLLDTATGDMWMMTNEVKNGSLGASVLKFVKRDPPADTPGLYQQYLDRNKAK